MAEFPKGLTKDVFIESHKRAFVINEMWRERLGNAYEFFVPQQNVFRSTHLSPGAKRDSRLMTSMPELAMNEGANKVKAAITPDWQNWAILKPGFELPEEVRENQEVKEQLQDITETLFSHIHNSNFSIMMGEAYKDWLIGTGAVEIRESTIPDTSILHYHTVNQEFIAYEEGPDESIENEYKFRCTAARNVERTYPGGDFSTDTRTAIKEKPSKEIKFLEGYVNVDGQYYLIVMEEGGDQLVWAEPQGTSNPVAVFRYARMSGEVRGRGPGISALPDAKELNKVKEFGLQNLAMELSGMFTAVDDGIFNANTMVLAPGVVIPVSSNGPQNPSLKRMESGGPLNMTFFEITEMKTEIREAFFNDLREPSDAVVSATQFSIETQELARRIGSAFGRILTEGLIPILNRSLEILQRRGIIPPFTIDGRQITVQFTSPLALAQDQKDLSALQQSIELSNLLIGPELTAMGYKLEDVPAFIASKTGLDVELVRSVGEREQQKNDLAAAALEAIPEGTENEQQQVA